MTAATASAPSEFSPSLRERAAASIRHPLARVLLVLTFTTGLVDAVSVLGLGRVFTANMTGNIVLLGFGIAGSIGLPVVAPLVSLGAFLAGAAGGGALAARMAARHPAHITWALGIEAAAFAAAAVLAASTSVEPGQLTAYGMIALLAFGMGLRNATVRKLRIPDLTTTVLTLTLTGLAADSPLADGTGKGSVRRTAAVVTMLVGAITGALMVRTSLVLPVAVAAGLALVILVLYLPTARAAPTA